MALSHIFLILSVLYVFDAVNGHGMLWEPPNRSSLWRWPKEFPGTRTNYQDNENFCGGFQAQFELNGGKCGLCGDDYRQPQPRDNELGGTYGRGDITRFYREGSNMECIVRITANHLGWFEFDLCNLDEDLVESEECFQKYPLSTVDGQRQYHIDNQVKDFPVFLSLPTGLTCEHCVLRWHYNSGNNWGVCDDKTGAIGCGNQETFKSCSDISIVKDALGHRRL